MRPEDGSFFAAYGASDPAAASADDGTADLSLAWDAAEQHGVRLLRLALPDARSWPVPVTDLSDAAARIRSAVRKRPFKQLARAAWGGSRLPADDTQLWLEAAGAMAMMQQHPGTGSPSLAPVSVLRPADWAGAVIGMVRCGVNSAHTAEGLVGYARQPFDIAELRGADDAGDAAYDPFASVAEDDESLLRAFRTAMRFWEALGVVSEMGWLTGLGWWGLPRALARAWNGDFDSDWTDSTPASVQERVWTGDQPKPEDLGISPPPLAF